MTLSDFRRALTDCLADGDFRNSVTRDPVDALAGYALTSWERARLLTTLGRSLVTRAGAPGPLAFVHESLPLTSMMLGAALRGTVDACWLEGTPRDTPHGVRFAAFLRARLGEGAFDIPWLKDVLAFETAALELTSIPSPSPSIARSPDAPMVHPHVRLVRFNTEPKTLLTRVWSGESTSQLSRSEHWLLLDGRTAPAEARDLTRAAGRALAQVSARKGPPAPMLDLLVSLGLVLPSGRW